MDTFLLFLLVGALAQAVDGALGMAYGVISSSVLLALGVPPAMASASVHGAEVFTTAASASSVNTVTANCVGLTCSCFASTSSARGISTRRTIDCVRRILINTTSTTTSVPNKIT